ncbi:MAG TPA: hypothetical protein EYP85_07035 [Armatimonadetes bacterium]|nr:hypothetical protein [Armatimonadota bacterium]
MGPLITLLTDFGDRDGFVGAMKGVLLSLCPTARIVDIAHHLEPQDVAHAAFVLATVYPYFPPDTIHLVVVDPGVGGTRRAIAVAAGNQRFVAPDNGCLTYVLAREGDAQAVILDRPQFFRSSVSRTFHGRDIFAPVAAYWAKGTLLEELGTAVSIEELVRLPVPQTDHRAGEVRGEVLTTDRFGNLITNISVEELAPVGPTATIWLGKRRIPLVECYEAVAEGELLALVNSAGYLEIALRQGNAAAELGWGRGTPVWVRATSSAQKE